LDDSKNQEKKESEIIMINSGHKRIINEQKYYGADHIEKSKKIGKYLILLSGGIQNVWTKTGTDKLSVYEVSVHLRQPTMFLTKGCLIETGMFADTGVSQSVNREHALNAYKNMKTVSDVHKYLHGLNPTDRPLHPSDARLKYNRYTPPVSKYDSSGYPKHPM
jgi:hypothetical protein